MTSTYKQVRDVLNAVNNFHKQLSDFYAKLMENSDKERVRMLLDYMSRHEENFKKATAEYNQQATEKLLDTWIQYSPDLGELSLPEPEEIDKDMTVDDVVDIAMKMDENLVEFYSKAAQMVDVQEAKLLFNKMQEQEKAEEAELRKNAQQIKRL